MSRRTPQAPRHGRNVRRNDRKRAKRYLVVCGGEVTEKEYFTHLLQSFDNVVIDIRSKARTPSQLADMAVKCMEDDAKDTSTDSYAEVFVVVDVDDFNDHDRAQRICDEHGIHLIISNPCFEVWLIDHLQPCPPSYTITADVERYAAQLGVTTGSRNKYIDFSKIDEHLDTALKNAQRHNSDTKKYHRKMLTPNKAETYAPWTDMPQVISEIKEQKSANAPSSPRDDNN